MPTPKAKFRILTLALLGVAVAISFWMAWVAWRSGALAGCGEGCSTVLGSHWAYLGPIPVSLLGAVIYLDTLIAVFRKKAGPVRILSAIILAGALYLTPNTGTDTLEITGVHADCGCTAVSGVTKQPPSPYAPSQTLKPPVAHRSPRLV